MALRGFLTADISVKEKGIEINFVVRLIYS